MNSSTGIDFAPIVTAYLHATIGKGRGDELLGHISDNYKCDAQIQYRRSAAKGIPPDEQTLWKWWMGHMVEAGVADAWQDKLVKDGYVVSRGGHIAWSPYEPGKYTSIDAYEAEYGPYIIDSKRELVGHYDLVAIAPDKTGFALDVKSSWFGLDQIPDHASDHYVMQTAGYAVAMGLEKFAVHQVACVKNGRRIEMRQAPTFWFETAEYRELVIQRAAEILENTAPGFPADMNPQQDWACHYCPFAQCTQNPKHNPAKEAVHV